MTSQTILVGNKGSGKSLFGAYEAKWLNVEYPKYPFVSNMQYNTPNARHYPDILAALAMSVICQSRQYWLTFVDEVAIAGWEARGSFSDPQASLRTYLVMLSRKVQKELTFSSQMISMMDKRLQWTGEVNILCKAHYYSEFSHKVQFPDWFSYTAFDEELNGMSINTISAPDALDYLVYEYDTQEIPLAEELMRQIMSSYRISPEQWEQYMEMENLREDPNPYAYETAKKWLDISKSDETVPAQIIESLGDLAEHCQVHEERDYVYVTTMPVSNVVFRKIQGALLTAYPPLYYLGKKVTGEEGKFVPKKIYEQYMSAQGKSETEENE